MLYPIVKIPSPKKTAVRKAVFFIILRMIPVPKFVVFYNGEEDQPAEYEMKLSDAFEKHVDNPELELVCKVYNINFGKNEKLLAKCAVIKQYMTFVDYVRFYHKEQDYDDLGRAINRAIDRCIEEDVLADFLKENRAEVIKVTQLDYTFDRQIMLEREEAREAGREEGRAEGRAEGREEGRGEGALKTLILQCCQKHKKGLSPEIAAEHLERSVEDIRKIYEAIEATGGKNDEEKVYHYLVEDSSK